ncbi:MAG TPA: CPBP family intramembrane glutamic endopeptidase [Herpetosiphonaceae bacterium]
MSALSLSQGPFWKKFTPLFVAGAAGVVALIPTISTLVKSQVERMPTPPPIPLPALTALSLIQPTLLVAGAVAIGAALAPRLGLRSHIVEKTVANRPLLPALKAELPLAATLGAIGFGVIAALDLLFRPLLGEAALALAGTGQHATILGVLGALLYGGITEELLLRWGLMTLLVWIGWRLVQRGEGVPRPALVWSAIVLAAVLFGLGHLPATSAVVPLTLPVVVRAILLNGLLGIVFGWLFWRRSLESAMLAHSMFHVCAAILALIGRLG